MTAEPRAHSIPLLSLIPGLGQSAERDVVAEANEQRYRDFLEALGVAMYTTDANGRITFFNQAAVQFWGRTPQLGEEWCGSWRLFWPDGRPMPHDECPMAIALRENRAPRGYEAIAERPDGSRVSFVPYPTPLRDPDGTLVGAVNVLVDVTERTRAESALRTAAEELRLSNEVKDEFLGLVSHELRTPVTTIFGNAQLLRERGDRLAEDDRDSMIDDIADDSERLLGVVENLLLLTRLESGSHPDPEPQVLGHIIRKSIEEFRHRHRPRRLQADRRVARRPNLGSAASRRGIRDRLRLASGTRSDRCACGARRLTACWSRSDRGRPQTRRRRPLSTRSPRRSAWGPGFSATAVPAAEGRSAATGRRERTEGRLGLARIVSRKCDRDVATRHARREGRLDVHAGVRKLARRFGDAARPVCDRGLDKLDFAGPVAGRAERLPGAGLVVAHEDERAGIATRRPAEAGQVDALGGDRLRDFGELTWLVREIHDERVHGLLR